MVMEQRKVSLLLFVCLGLAYLASVQAQAELTCPTFTISDLGSSTSLSTNGLLSEVLGSGGEGGTSIPAQVLNYTILCDASGSRRGTSSYVSVLVQFRCDSSSLNVCDGSTVITNQFQFSCGAGNVWTDSIFGSDSHIRTVTPSIAATPSNQCRACVDNEQVANPAIDTDTHCFPCSSDCNEGQRRCYIGGSGDVCCNFYLENNCVAACPTGLVANSTHDCECPELSLDGGEVTYTNNFAIGSVATHTCSPGYRQEGGSTRTCTSAAGWDGNNVTCMLIKCPTELSIDNGNVEISPSEGTLGAKATYSCTVENYSLKGGDRERYCQMNNEWNGTAPQCDKCLATDIDPDCIECAFDASGNPICRMCKGGLSPGADGKCTTGNTNPSTGSPCGTGCIVGIVLAILGAVIMAVLVTLMVYYIYSNYAPATKLAKAGTEGLNGVARDNPLYLPPEDIIGDVETA